MKSATRPRRLTDAEVAGLRRAHAQLIEARQSVNEYSHELDRLIADLADDGARSAEIAEALGAHRQLVYDAKRRVERERHAAS